MPENASETVAFYKCISGTFCHWGRKWDILSSGTICRLRNAGGTICRWDKMSPNLTYSEDSSKWIKTQQSSQSFWWLSIVLDLCVETLGGAPHQCKWVDNPNFFSDPFEGLPLRTLRGCSPPADADSSENQSHWPSRHITFSLRRVPKVKQFSDHLVFTRQAFHLWKGKARSSPQKQTGGHLTPR